MMNEEYLEEGLGGLLIAGLVGTLLGLATSKKVKGFVAAMIKKTKDKKKLSEDLKKLNKGKDVNMDALQKASAEKYFSDAMKWENKIPQVFEYIEKKDPETAASYFKNTKYEDNKEAIKAIALKITDVYGEPPLYIYPAFNESYRALKTITNPKVGRAVSQAFVTALKDNKTYYQDINLNMGE